MLIHYLTNCLYIGFCLIEELSGIAVTSAVFQHLGDAYRSPVKETVFAHFKVDSDISMLFLILTAPFQERYARELALAALLSLCFDRRMIYLRLNISLIIREILLNYAYYITLWYLHSSGDLFKRIALFIQADDLFVSAFLLLSQNNQSFHANYGLSPSTMQ